MLDYPALLAVSTIVREGSFERAAHILGMTPSAVSQRVRGFEERLGTILIIRGKPCTPTPLGRKLCTHLEHVRLLETALPPLPHRGTPPPPSLRVAVNADSMATWFPSAMTDVAHVHHLSLDISLEDETHTAHLLRDNHVIAAVTADPTPIPGCRTIPLGRLPYVACASPRYLDQYLNPPLTAEQLRRWPVLRFNQHDGLQERWANEAYHTSLTHAPTHWIPSTQGFFDITSAGIAWAMLPLPLLQTALHHGDIVELPPYHRLYVSLYWVMPRLHVPALHPLTKAVTQSALKHLAPCEHAS